MPANWDLWQKINFGTGQVEWPTGPMMLASGETPTWVDAWVVQYSMGASQSTRQWTNWVPTLDRWTAAGIPPGWKNGNFQPAAAGQAWPALGIALLASHNSTTGTDEVFPWLDLIVLY
jgi:hypothetical protein